MPPISLNLLVLTTCGMETLLAFYRTLGLKFAEEQHGNGPIHYGAKCGDLVFELYPASENRPVDSTTRLGFAVANLDDVIVELQKLGAPIVTPATSTEWGYRAVVRDPDGRAVELTQR